MTHDPTKPVPRSVALAAEKARIQRVQRLKGSLDQRIENPIAAIDALMAELGEGERHPELWEKLHVAAVRDKLEAEVADAYAKCAAGPRMKRLKPDAQADLLMHAADYKQGIQGDAAAAEVYVEKVLAVVPNHAEAFQRFERRLEKQLDSRRLLELYATVATDPPKPVTLLATQAYNRVLQLSPKDVLSDDACRHLVALVPTQPKLLDALEGHCRTTKRPALACDLIERALAGSTADRALTTQRRHRVVELYLGEAASPSSAIGHVEALLTSDPADAVALKAAERLLSTRDVASRAAAALQTARRTRGA